MSSEISTEVMVENGAIIQQDVFDTIRELHDKVSMEDTPRSFIKNKMGLDYVEYSYMRKLADKFYPGWSWTIISKRH